MMAGALRRHMAQLSHSPSLGPMSMPVSLRLVSALPLLALVMSACASTPPAPRAEPAVTPEVQEPRSDPHGTWTFELISGSGSYQGSMTIGREPGTSRMTIRDLGVVNEVVQNDELQLRTDGDFRWTGTVGGSAFVMNGRVDGDELNAVSEATGLGTVNIRGRREER